MNRIAMLRKENHMNQAKLAEKVGVHQTAVSQWEREETTPAFEAICRMCDVFDVSLGYLMGQTSLRTPHHMSEKEQDELAAAVIADEEADEWLSLLKKYRKLDTPGKELVMTVLMHEVKRVENMKVEYEANTWKERRADAFSDYEDALLTKEATPNANKEK